MRYKHHISLMGSVFLTEQLLFIYKVAFYFQDQEIISLISAGISLSCGKGRMDIRVVFQTQTRRCFVDNDISVYEI